MQLLEPRVAQAVMFSGQLLFHTRPDRLGYQEEENTFSHKRCSSDYVSLERSGETAAGIIKEVRELAHTVAYIKHALPTFPV